MYENIKVWLLNYFFGFPVLGALNPTDLQITLVSFYTFHTVVPESYSIKILRQTVEINRKPRVIYLRLTGLTWVITHCVLKLPQNLCGDDTGQK